MGNSYIRYATVDLVLTVYKEVLFDQLFQLRSELLERSGEPVSDEDRQELRERFDSQCDEIWMKHRQALLQSEDERSEGSGAMLDAHLTKTIPQKIPRF